MQPSAKENKMGTAPVLPLILTMSLPAMFSMLIQALYNIVDSVFVARLGENALTAVSLAFPVQSLLIAVAVGTGIGLNSVISRRLGEHNQEAADNAASHGIFLALINGAIFAILGILFTKPFFMAFTKDPEVVKLGCDYIYLITICCFGNMVHIVVEKIIQATGNMLYPMLFQLVGAVTNLILDPIMIFGLLGFPAMGVQGAALATVSGQILAMAFSLYVVLTRSHAVKIQIKGFRFHPQILKDIYSVGVPSMIMQSIASVMITLLNGILITFSGAAVSVLGIYYKLQSFVFMPVFGLNQGLMPIMGYNYGAGNRKRLTDALKGGIGVALCIMTIGTLIFQLFPVQLLQMFNSSEEMMSIGVIALRTLSLCFIPAAFGVVLSTLFQALGNGVYSLSVSVMRQLLFIVPIAYVFSKVFGLDQVWMSMPIAEVIACVISFFMLSRIYHKKIEPMENR